MVLLQLERQEIPNWTPDQPGDKSRLLENHRKGQGDFPSWASRRNEENPSVLQRSSPKG